MLALVNAVFTLEWWIVGWLTPLLCAFGLPMKKLCTMWNVFLFINNFSFSFLCFQVTHRHTILMAIFSSEPGLAGCRLDFPSPLIPRPCILLGQPQTLHILLDTLTFSANSSLVVPCLFLSASIVMQCFTQWSSFWLSPGPNHLNLPLLITKLTVSSPTVLCINFPFSLKPCIHLCCMFNIWSRGLIHPWRLRPQFWARTPSPFNQGLYQDTCKDWVVECWTHL